MSCECYRRCHDFFCLKDSKNRQFCHKGAVFCGARSSSQQRCHGLHLLAWHVPAPKRIFPPLNTAALQTNACIEVARMQALRDSMTGPAIAGKGWPLTSSSAASLSQKRRPRSSALKPFRRMRPKCPAGARSTLGGLCVLALPPVSSVELATAVVVPTLSTIALCPPSTAARPPTGKTTSLCLCQSARIAVTRTGPLAPTRHLAQPAQLQLSCAAAPRSTFSAMNTARCLPPCCSYCVHWPRQPEPSCKCYSRSFQVRQRARGMQ